jgi:MraZ protein
LIPAVLRESAQIAGEVVVLGSQTHLDVWNHERFLDQRVRTKPWTEEDAETMGNLGI